MDMEDVSEMLQRFFLVGKVGKFFTHIYKVPVGIYKYFIVWKSRYFFHMGDEI